MGDSSCLPMPGVDCEREVSIALAFGGSVSFGRFMSESLDWGRWSSFRHNRHLEEVERYARPGSVAQKKAFFEAHYKKMAALKKAGSLEESVDVISDNQEESVDMTAGSTDEVTGNKCEELKVMPNDERPNLADENGGLEGDHEVDENQSPEEKEDFSFTESAPVIQSSCGVEDIGNQISESAISPLKEIFVANRVSLGDSADKKPRISVLKSPNPGSKPFRFATCVASKLSPSSVKHSPASKDCAKENKFTPTNYGARCSSEKIRSNAKSIHRSMNVSECPRGSVAKHFSTKAPSILEKVQQFEATSNSSKASNHRLCPYRKSAQPSGHNVSKLSPVTQDSARARTPLVKTYSGRRKVDMELQNLTSNCSKLLSIGGTRSRMQATSSSASCKADERAEKPCKEAFSSLANKFCTKEVKKIQIQRKTTEKTESRVAKLRQSFCSRVTPMIDFSQNFEPLKNERKKIPLTQPRSPKLGRRNRSALSPGSNSLMPLTPTITDGLIHCAGKSSHTPRRPASSRVNKRN
ncbi:TPX2 C-terminal protein [Dioscorea alata]|uniref:TPX2 C-terminal protein n=1 Tax=Dioscorea alata TaxID=55571 RepID=A0ACB7W227_DIOAL|nr:TPX2 C-terminal protein [Dioscorea alata]